MLEEQHPEGGTEGEEMQHGGLQRQEEGEPAVSARPGELEAFGEDLHQGTVEGVREVQHG